MLGFYLGIDGEVNFSLIGTTAGVVSSVFVSLNGIFTSKVLSKVNDDKSLLLFYNNVNAMFLFLPLIIFFEKDVSFKFHWRRSSNFMFFLLSFYFLNI
jgi:GDP-fucose transporter C1